MTHELHWETGVAALRLEDGEIHKKYEVVIPQDVLKNDIERFIQAKANTTKVPGFRPGKAPLERVFAEHSGQALDALVRHHIQEAVKKILEENSWSLVCPPQYDITTQVSVESLEKLAEAPLHVTVDFFLKPTMPSLDFATLHVPTYTVTLAPKTLEEVLEAEAASTFTTAPLEAPRPAQLGDTLVYQLEYSDDNGLIKEVEGKLRLGDGMFPKDFEETLVGTEAGHVTQQRIRVPKDFPDKSLAGRKIHFKLAFHEILQSVPHLVDEALAKAKGYDTLEAMKEAVAQNLQSNLQQEAEKLSLAHLEDALDEALTFDVPQILVQEQERMMWNHVIETANGLTQGKDVFKHAISRMLSQYGHIMAEAATHQVRRTLFLEKLVAEKNISFTEKEFANHCYQVCRAWGQEPQVFFQNLQKNPQHHKTLQEAVKMEKARALILSQCTHVAETVSLEELRKKWQAQREHKEKKQPWALVTEHISKLETSAPELENVTPHVHDENCHHGHHAEIS